MDARLLFPPAAHESPPTEAFIADYDVSLGKVLTQDGVMYYTENPTVIQFRGELWQELLENKRLLSECKDFTTRFRLSKGKADQETPLWKELTAYKENLDSIRQLTDYLKQQSFQSAAINGMKKCLTAAAESHIWREAEEKFRRIPEDFLQIKSITLGINLDSSGNALEAGIEAINPFYFVSDHPLEKLLHPGEALHPTNPLLKPESGQEEAYLALNRELMRAVDRVIRKELKKMRVDCATLLNQKLGIGEGFVNEIHFVVEFAELLTKMLQCGAEIRYLSEKTSYPKKATVNIRKTLDQIRLGYEASLIADSEGVWKRTLAIFGVEILANR